MTAGGLVLVGDASPRLGAGHVMRLSAIADAARAAGRHARLVVGGEPGTLVDQLVEAGHDVVAAGGGADPILRAAADLGATSVVVDGARPAGLAPRLAAAGLTVAALDDGVGEAPIAAIVVNPGFGAEAHPGRYPAADVRLLGRDYALLRAAFLAWPRGGPPARAGRLRVLVTFGGSDPLGATPSALAALPASSPLEVFVVAGPGFGHAAVLERAVRAARAAGHSVHRLGPVTDMARLMASCDAAICGAGGTLAELAYLGRPAAAYAVAPDQVALARAQAEAGLVHGGLDLAMARDPELAADLAAFLADPDRRARLAARAAATVDGRGARRVVAALP